MSFSFVPTKSLICRMCTKQFPSDEVDFPDDLFYLITRYNMSQIHWFCKSCNEYVVTPDRFRNLTFRVENLEKVTSRIDHLENEVIEIKTEGRTPRKVSRLHESGIQCNYDSSFRVDSTGSPETSLSEGFISMNLRGSPSPPINRRLELASFSNSASLSDPIRRSHSTTSLPRQIFQSPEDTSKQSKEGNRILTKILDTVAINRNEAADSIAAVDAFVMALNNYLKEQFHEYKYLYSKEYKTGSSFNELKISKADEYDINIVLIAPAEFLLEVEFFESKAFAKIKWSTVKQIPASKECVEKFFKNISDAKGYIKPLQVKSWFHSIIDKFCLSDANRKIKGIKKFINSESGPARTIKIETEKGNVISLDLVPVFTFGFEILSTNDIPRIKQYPLEKSNSFCSFVPKLCDGEENLSVEDCKLSWRTYIPEIDKAVWHNKQVAKPIIKLLKLLKQRQNWTSIASYHMATVILWEIHDNPPDCWRGSMKYDMFIKALEKLQGYLHEKKLPYFLYPPYNLFHKLKPAHSENMSGQIQHMLKQIRMNPNNLLDILLTEEQICEYNKLK